MNLTTNNKFVLLVILDGWGIAAPAAGNAISQANTVNMNRFWLSYPHGQIKASGEEVGLPRGEAGNTETGHLNLGAGRIVYQDLERINMSIADGSFFENKTLLEAIEHAKKNNSKLHYMGLIGAGGVHSSMSHLSALIHLAKKQNFTNLYIHLFTDGRDSSPTSALTYVNNLREVIKKEGIGQIASIMGRYWAMDRDRRWDRTAKAYLALTKGEGHLVKSIEEVIEMSYAQGKTDEFIDPSIVTGPDTKPIGLIGENDAVIFFNFRIDRPRQLTSAFLLDDFTTTNVNFGFDPYLVKYAKKHEAEDKTSSHEGDSIPFIRGDKLKNLCFVTMTEYSKPLVTMGTKVAFPPEIVPLPLGKIIADNNLRQLRISESEKERFVTFYFNGLQEAPFDGERRIIIPSPKVSTYDQKPEMSAREITDTFINEMKGNGGYSFSLINFANADMLGHTGNIGSTVTACGVLDECIGKLANFVLAYGGTMIITADHGNAEQMIDDQTGKIETEHSSNPVPFIAISNRSLGKAQTLSEGILADIAPTILKLLGLEVPSSMTGHNLLETVELS